MRVAFGYLRWTPEVFWSSTMTEFLSATEGLNEVNQAKAGKSKVEPPTGDEMAKLLARYGGPK